LPAPLKIDFTVRDCFHRWKKRGMEGLWEKMGRGRKKKWKEDDLVYVEKCLEEDSRTYNAAQLARKLATERKVVLSQDRLRKILKARGWVWKRTRYKQPNGADPQVKLAKKADLDWLFWAHSAGEIRLKFLDESGFSLWSPVSYTYARLGEQKVLEQTKRRGKRLNILGLYSKPNLLPNILKRRGRLPSSFKIIIPFIQVSKSEIIGISGSSKDYFSFNCPNTPLK